MRKIIYLPLENLEQRYSKMMNQIIYPKVNFIIYPDDFPELPIKKGQFLDINRTCNFKALQLAKLSKFFEDGFIRDGDIFLIADIFFPGIEMIRYMADLQNISISIYGFNYAGRADRTDFVRKLGGWSDSSELGYHRICDGIFVGSDFHKSQVVDYFNLPEHMVYSTGYIWDSFYCESIHSKSIQLPWDKREELVIWPHRVCNEKGINDLIEISTNNPKWNFIITSSGHNDIPIKLPDNVTFINKLSKKQYYNILSNCKYYLSTGYQETFGYTVQEAMYYGCEILVPNRACYPEMVPERCLYNHNSEVINKFGSGDKIITEEFYLNKFQNNVEQIFKIINENFSRR